MAIRKVFKPQANNDGRCSGCAYYDTSTGDVDDGAGYCRRSPPIGGEGWPVVDHDDWCGEYKAAQPVEHLSIPEAGARYFGLGVNGSYLAARRGDLPWVQIGKYKRVPVSAMRHLQPKE